VVGEFITWMDTHQVVVREWNLANACAMQNRCPRPLQSVSMSLPERLFQQKLRHITQRQPSRFARGQVQSRDHARWMDALKKDVLSRRTIRQAIPFLCQTLSKARSILQQVVSAKTGLYNQLMDILGC